MLAFNDISLEDYTLVSRYTINSNRRSCDLSFSNLCSWYFLYHTQVAEEEGFLFLKFRAEGKLLYMPPVGEGDFGKALEKIIEDANLEGENLRISGVTPDVREELEKLMPGMFSFTEFREYSDNIYLRKNLVELSGKKYQSKRNHINKFKKSYQYEYLPLTAERINECIRMEAEWCRANNCNDEDGTSDERRAVIFALNHFEKLGLSGGLLRVDGKTVAFTLGMPINHDTFGIHVEKADTNIDGAYTMINNEFAKHIPEQYTYINREEDLGIEGLRKAKLSYNPEIILDKSIARLRSTRKL